MNSGNKKLTFDYKDKDCNYCPTRPILEQFKNYTGSPEDCERLRNYIATEIFHSNPSYSAQPRSLNQPQMVNSNQPQLLNPNQPQQYNHNQPQQYNHNQPQQYNHNQPQRIKSNQPQQFNSNQPQPYKTIPKASSRSTSIDPHFVDLNSYNQNNFNRGPVGCCNNDTYICFKTSTAPIQIQGLPCQKYNNGVPCCIRNSYNPVPNANQAANPSPYQQPPRTNANRYLRNYRLKQMEPCNRENCVHKTPDSTCLYGKPCKAHCFNTPPGAGRRGA